VNKHLKNLHSQLSGGNGREMGERIDTITDLHTMTTSQTFDIQIHVRSGHRGLKKRLNKYYKIISEVTIITKAGVKFV